MNSARFLAVAALGALALATPALAGGPRRLISSPDGARLAVVGESGAVQVVDAQSGAKTALSFGAAPSEIAFSPDASLLAACLVNGTLALGDAASGSVRALESGVYCSDLAWSKDSAKVYYLITKIAAPGPEPDEIVELRVAGARTGERRVVHSATQKSSLPPRPRSTPARPQPVVLPTPPPIPEPKAIAPAKAPPPADPPYTPPARKEPVSDKIAPAPAAHVKP